MKISQKIALLRALKGISQIDLAKIAQVSNKAISAWESDIRSPKIEPLQRICAYYGMNLNRFIDAGNDYYGQESESAASRRDLSQQEIIAALDQLSDEDIAFLKVLVSARIESHKAKDSQQ